MKQDNDSHGNLNLNWKRIILVGFDKAGKGETAEGIVTYMVPKETQVVSESFEGVERNYRGFLGGEYAFSQEEWVASVRAGANSTFLNSRDILAVTGGAGIGYRGFSFEYAYPYNTETEISLGKSHRVAIEVRLGEFMAGDKVTSSMDRSTESSRRAQPDTGSEPPDEQNGSGF